jgi:hypothetical protein
MNKIKDVQKQLDNSTNDFEILESEQIVSIKKNIIFL